MISKQNEQFIDASRKNMDDIAGNGENGWNEMDWGQEVIFKNILPRLEPDDKIVDIGSDWGRCSMSMSLMGYKVVNIDLNLQALLEGRRLRKLAGAREADELVMDFNQITKDSLNIDFNVIIASDLFIHFQKAACDNLIQKIPTLLDKNKRGLIYLNAPSTMSTVFQYPEILDGIKLDEKTIEILCSCSGTLKREPIPFYEPGEIEFLLLSKYKNINILETDLIERVPGSIMHELVLEFISEN